jgi:sugar/nucleoside kinase (ribokinase family)
MNEALFVFHERPYRRITSAASYPQDRAFITYYDPEPQVPAAIPALTKASARVLYIPGLYTGPFLTVGKRLVKAKKMKLVMDGNSSVGDISGNSKECKALRNAIKSLDIFLPNALEARMLTGEQDLDVAILRLGELCPLVVIKDGPNGSLAYINHKISKEPAIQVDPIDTTGAGDNFNAGFLCAWLKGEPLESCLKWGNIVGGLSTTASGGTVRKITSDEVYRYLSSDKK